MPLQPVEEVFGNLICQVIVNEAKDADLIWLSFNWMYKLFEAYVWDIVLIEYKRGYMRLVMLILYVGTNALNTFVKDTVIRVVYLLEAF